MTTKEIEEIAVKDIQQELKKQGRVFINYIRELDPVMEAITSKAIKEQEDKACLKK